MFLQNWYPRETSLLFTGRQMLCSMSVRKCIQFCILELQSWREVKNTNMKFMKTQDKNTQISVYCIQHYCKWSFSIIKQLLPALAVNIIIVHPRGVVFPSAKALGWTIMMFTLSAGNNCILFRIRQLVPAIIWHNVHAQNHSKYGFHDECHV